MCYNAIVGHKNQLFPKEQLVMKPSKRNRIFLILLALLTFVSVLSSCAADTESDKPSAATETETTEAETTSALSTIEKKDFGGYEYRIVSTNQG